MGANTQRARDTAHDRARRVCAWVGVRAHAMEVRRETRPRAIAIGRASSSSREPDLGAVEDEDVDDVDKDADGALSVADDDGEQGEGEDVDGTSSERRDGVDALNDDEGDEGVGSIVDVDAATDESSYEDTDERVAGGEESASAVEADVDSEESHDVDLAVVDEETVNAVAKVDDSVTVSEEEAYSIVEDVAAKVSTQLADTTAEATSIDFLALSQATDSTDTAQTVREEAMNEQVAAFSMVVMISILLLTIILGVALKHYKSRWVHQSGAALALGLALGCFVFFALESSYATMSEDMRYTVKAFAKCMQFDTQFFFLVLLPPVIFEAGYTLHPTTFFQNADAISMFAFLGSFTSSITTGVLMYAAGVFGLGYEFSLKSSLLFGALISSTDPVTTLSVFNDSPINPDVHAIILGESVLNDAVSIVYFESLLSGFGNYVANSTATSTAQSALDSDEAFMPLLVQAAGMFMLAFGQATLIGVGIGFISTLLHKYVNTTNDWEEGWVVDSTIVLLFPYMSYATAESLNLSGIVAVMFTGIVMGRFTRPNLSRAPRMVTMCLFKTFSFLSETFVFIYMGSAMYQFRFSSIVTACVGLVATYIGRAVNVFPGAALVNMLPGRRSKEHRMSSRLQYTMWFCGMRGAVAFALAVKASRDIGEQGRMMLDVTMFIVLITVVVQGGMTNWVLDALGTSTDSFSTRVDADGPSTPRRTSSLGELFSSMGNDNGHKTVTGALSESTSLLGASNVEKGTFTNAFHSGALASDAVETAVSNTFGGGT